eukprot:CAMPEP_0172547490 /NCGR_PEP_ID=MMETSP1067-20121228/17012_1 /TAXON_ID=265564 ORGANISM="Thalassiosira punctigera, Strain Tpunct2005C2" /NCGR_SAMPLE_ID=MMETSP1067 /ASSEMBLY_ACC=CAM_ASM_000444 /LENGTH=934 /DNA_ID=CAMNT_0013334581 /DNA_START=324 /DNA_END=3128 /DNA_ORIENTATION=-
MVILLAISSTSHPVEASNLRSPHGAYPPPTTSSTSSPTSVLKDFVTWSARALSLDGDGEERAVAYPLWSTPTRIADHYDNVLFSFPISGSALRRRRRRQEAERRRRLQYTETEIFIDLGGDGSEENAQSEGYGEAGVARDEGHGDATNGNDHVGAKAMGDTAHGDGHGDGDDTHSDAHEMVVHVTYEDIYKILVFMIVATGLGIFTSKLGMPALVGEIFAGFLLGPPLADFVPFSEALVLVGEIGLIMLLLEAGVELDVAQLRETGVRALSIGLTGTLLPLLVGMGLGMASGASSIKSALAIGASFSPTSLGVAASALKSGKMLDTPVGQLIVAACVVDDVLALILLSMFKVLVKDNPPIIEYFIPIISSVGFLIVLGGSAVTWMPRLIENKILKRCSEPYRVLVMFSVMAVILLAYLPLLNYTQASYLTGAFLCGCIFSQIEHAHHTFMEQTHQLMTWLLRVFFAASIGFQVPVTQFGDPKVIMWGFILYLCVIAKLPLALFVPQFEDVKKGASYNPFIRDRILTALAMTCRGEFSFIIAAFALGEGLFTAQMYSAIVWAVLMSCISSPFILLNLIKHFNKKQLDYLASTNPIKLAKDGDGVTPLFLHIKAKAPAFGGMQEQFRSIVNELGLEVVERRTNRNGRGLNATVQTDLFVRDTTMTVKLQKIAAQKKIKRALASAVEATMSSTDLVQTMMAKNGSIRPSSSNLSQLSLVSLQKEAQEALQQAATEEDAIITRGDIVEKKIKEALFAERPDKAADVTVDVWNPWPWTSVLDIIGAHYGVTDDPTQENVEIFVAVFDKIDVDGGGSIDQEEMYQALVDAGLDITEEGVITLFAMIDEDGNGDIDRDEWRETIKFYLELKEEEAEMSKQKAEYSQFRKDLRAKKLEQLGKSVRALTKEKMEMVEGEVKYEKEMGEDGDASDNSIGLDIDA